MSSCSGRLASARTHLRSAWPLQRHRAAGASTTALSPDLITSLEEGQAAGRLQARLKVLTHPALLVVDEIGYLPVGSSGGNLFFQLVNACYERCAMILTSNRGFSEWADIFGDAVVATALLDRLLHHAVVIAIEGNSYRLREHADLVPEHLRSRPIPKIVDLPEPKRRRGRPPKEAA
jgi:IstB-like ATP binding protein